MFLTLLFDLTLSRINLYYCQKQKNVNGSKQNWNSGNVLEMCQDRREAESLRGSGLPWHGLPHTFHKLKRKNESSHLLEICLSCVG